MSINKAQATALAEGFLNGLGSDPEDFKPVETVTQAMQIAAEFADLMASNCPTHEGRLAASISLEQPEQIGSTISISITMLKYGQYVDKGVKGTKGGIGLFAFKYDMPSASMIKAIEQYIKASQLSTSNIKNHPISKHEKKNTSISKAESAFAMARAIKQHGIKPIYFINRSAQVIDSKYDVAVTDGFIKDIYNSIPDSI